MLVFTILNSTELTPVRRFICSVRMLFVKKWNSVLNGESHKSFIKGQNRDRNKLLKLQTSRDDGVNKSTQIIEPKMSIINGKIEYEHNATVKI